MLPPALDALGHAQLRQGPADADHGYGPRRRAGALPQHQGWGGLLQVMSRAKKLSNPAGPQRNRTVGKRSGPAVAAAHLPSEAELRRLAERIFKLSEADETEVQIDFTSDALTRFANNTIHQNVAERMLSVSVRTVFDGCTARATTNKTDAESLLRVVAASATLARSQPRNPDLLPMPGPQKYPRVERFFPATAAASPEDRARAIARVVTITAKTGQTAAGIFSIGVLEENSSGWAKANSPDIADIAPDALAEGASQKAIASRAPRELAPGHYTVILEPAAPLDGVGFLFYEFSATAVRDQRYCLPERLGKHVMGPNINLWDDVCHPLQLGAPFDGEGLPRQEVLLVERGVPRNLVYSRAAAKKMNVQAT